VRYRRVGAGGPDVSAVGLGGTSLSSTYRQVDDTTAMRVVARALDLGITHFDTADVYAGGRNEELLGKALRSRRSDVFVASKFGQVVRDGKRLVDGTPSHARASCDGSLKRLGVDHLDLYYLHRVDPEVPIEETVGAMAELVAAGKVRHIGLSEAAPMTIRRAHAVHPLTAIQVEYSLWTRFGEAEHFPLCEELGLAYVAYAPVGRGFLSGEIKSAGDLEPEDFRHSHPRFQQEAIERNVALLDVLRDVAIEHGRSPSQTALAWLLAQADFLFPIPATSNPLHVEENAAAADIELSDDQIARLSEAFRDEAVTGDRYPPVALGKVQQ
jgi:aryl-alcohol dehydrogenase-like predicted oxidoreductase